MPQDLYASLGVAKDASATEIKKAYRKLAMKHHPDKGGDEKKFKEITFAYEILSDPAKRSQYDQHGSAAFGGGAGGAGGSGGPGGFGGFDFSNFGQASGVNFNFEDLGDLFETFFGGRRGGGGQRARAGGIQGRDVEAQVSLTFEDMVKGTEKTINFEVHQTCNSCNGKGYKNASDVHTCSTCNGTGEITRITHTFFGKMQQSVLCADCNGSGKEIKNKCSGCHGEGRKLEKVNLKIQIPSGVEDKTVLRLSGKGEAGAQSAPSGDLYVQVNVATSNTYERKRQDLYMKSKIDLLQAVLGDVIDIKTPYEKKKVKLPGGSLHGQRIKLSGDGLVRPGSYEKGDLYIELEVEMPKKLSKEEYKLYEKLAKDKGLKIDPQIKSSWL